MANRRYGIPDYGTTMMNGTLYYRTRLYDADGKRFSLYGRTKEELYEKVLRAKDEIEHNSFRRSCPTVKEYAEKWLYLQSAQISSIAALVTFHPAFRFL